MLLRENFPIVKKENPEHVDARDLILHADRVEICSMWHRPYSLYAKTSSPQEVVSTVSKIAKNKQELNSFGLHVRNLNKQFGTRISPEFFHEELEAAVGLNSPAHTFRNLNVLARALAAMPEKLAGHSVSLGAVEKDGKYSLAVTLKKGEFKDSFNLSTARSASSEEEANADVEMLKEVLEDSVKKIEAQPAALAIANAKVLAGKTHQKRVQRRMDYLNS